MSEVKGMVSEAMRQQGGEMREARGERREARGERPGLSVAIG